MPLYRSLIFLFSLFCFKLFNFVVEIVPRFGPESSTSFLSYIVHIISIHLAWVLQPLQLACFLLSNNLSILHQTMVYAALTYNDLDSLFG
jgi:hypothetical protein